LTISVLSKSFCFFSLSVQFVPNSLFKKEKLAKSDLGNASDNPVNFFLTRCDIKYYEISHTHIGDGYRQRKLVITGGI
jgi:hypothetical protein